MRTRQKGITFEREVATALTTSGYHVRGLEAGGDHLAVTADGRVLHVECKRQERLRIPEWIAQVEADAGELPWALVFRQSRRRAYVIMPLDQFVTP